jgi:hypothetical protein
MANHKRANSEGNMFFFTVVARSIEGKRVAA